MKTTAASVFARPRGFFVDSRACRCVEVVLVGRAWNEG